MRRDVGRDAGCRVHIVAVAWLLAIPSVQGAELFSGEFSVSGGALACIDEFMIYDTQNALAGTIISQACAERPQMNISVRLKMR